MIKKFLKLFIVVISILSFSVKATSVDLSLEEDTNLPNEITLNLKINKLTDFNGSCEGLCGLVATLEYNKEKLELLSAEASNGFDLTSGKNLVLYKETGVKDSSNILTLKFKNKNLENSESTTVSLVNLTATDGDKDIKLNDVKKIITFANNNSNNNSSNRNNNNNTSKGNNASKPNNSKKEEKSTNNYLELITISSGSISFSKDKLIYDVVVKNNVKNILISAKTEDEKAIVEGDGRFNLNIGNNTIKINVTAEDDTQRTYTLNIYREYETKIENDNIADKNNNIIKYIGISLGVLVVIVASVTIYKKVKDK